MKLYIANCTKQEYHFSCRIPEIPGVKIFQIQIGGQNQIAGELNKPQIDAIVEHGGIYGLSSAAEFERVGAFVPLIYSEGKPVPAEMIRRCMGLNNGVLIQQGKDMREQAAVAVSAQMSEMTPNLETLEMTVIEEKRGNSPDGDPMAEGVRVTRLPDQGVPARNKGGRPRKAR